MKLSYVKMLALQDETLGSVCFTLFNRDLVLLSVLSTVLVITLCHCPAGAGCWQQIMSTFHLYWHKGLDHKKSGP